MDKEIDLTVKEAMETVSKHMLIRYGMKMEELQITSTPGYWEDKEPRMHPGHPLHTCLFCDGPFKATYTYLDPIRDSNGRFASPYRTWAILYQLEASK